MHTGVHERASNQVELITREAANIGRECRMPNGVE